MLVRRGTLLALVTLLVIGCSGPYDQKIPSGNLKNWTPDESFKAAVVKLPSEDLELLKAFLVRRAMASAFGAGDIPEGMTVRKAIDEQKQWVAQQQAKASEEKALAERVAAERETRTKLIQDVVTVSVTGLQFQGSDIMARRYSDRFLIRVAFANKGDKAIAGVKGIVHFADIFGDELKDVTISFDKGLASKGTAEDVFEGDYNRFEDTDKKLAQTPAEKLRVSWEPQTVIFEDGTKLALN